MTNPLMDTLNEGILAYPDLVRNFSNSLLALLLVWVFYRLIVRFIRQRAADSRARYTWQKVARYTLLPLAVVWVGSFWFEAFSNTATFLGLLTAGLALAMREVIVSLAGWVFILVGKPFRVGDRVQISGIKGDVLDLSIFNFTLLEVGNWVDADQNTGRLVYIPNAKVFTDPITNETSDLYYLWNEITVTVTGDSDWKSARGILERIVAQHTCHLQKDIEQRLKEAASKFILHNTNLTPAVYTRIKDRGIELSLRYLCEPRQRRASADAIWLDILNEFSQHSEIRIAHP